MKREERRRRQKQKRLNQRDVVRKRNKLLRDEFVGDLSEIGVELIGSKGLPKIMSYVLIKNKENEIKLNEQRQKRHAELKRETDAALNALELPEA